MGATTTKRPSGGRTVVERRTITAATHTITMQRELVPCGDERCRRCPHGPYWYAYWKQDGRTRSAYVGKHCDAAKAREAVANKQRRA